MALIAAHLNAGHSGGDSVAIGIHSPSSPTSIPPSPILPVPKKPYGFCGRKATLNYAITDRVYCEQVWSSGEGIKSVLNWANVSSRT